MEQVSENRYLNYLINTIFRRVDRLFVLSFETTTDKRAQTGYYLAKVEINDYNAILDFDQYIKSHRKLHEDIRKITIVWVDDYTTDCLLDNYYVKGNYKMIVIGLPKQQELDVDLRAIQ